MEQQLEIGLTYQSVTIETPSEKPEYLITEPDELSNVFEHLQGYDVIAVDTETTGLDYVRDQLHGFSVATPNKSWYITHSALMPGVEKLATLSQDATKLFVLHNAKFDKHFLDRYGFRPKRIADTLIAQWLCDENMELALKSLAHTRLGYGVMPTYEDLVKETKKRLGKKKMADVTIYDLPINQLAEYAARDTEITLKLWNKVVYDLHQENMEQVFWDVEMPFVQVLFEMEQAGMFIDQAAVAELEGEFTAAREAAYNTWVDISGGVNPNSTKQLIEYLFNKCKLPVQGKTAGDQPSTDELTMQRLEPLDTTGGIKALRTYRKYDKLMGTYIDMLRLKPFEGRLHGKLNQTGTVTGRLSASEPNLQNIPSRGDMGKKMRKVFGSPEGYDLIVGDYSQIELRMLANESKEKAFLKVFEEDGDPHQLTAELAHVERRVGKTINFAWAYGAGPRKIADTIEKDGYPRPAQSDARQWLDNFNDAYPSLVRWKASVIRRARELGYVPTLGGRKRRLPDLNCTDRDLRGAAERQCVNARIQGSCADMIKWSMLQLQPWLKMYGARMLIQVHDELVVESPKEATAELIPIVQENMESIKTKFNLNVRIIAEPNSGANWKEAK